jgi:copper transport protein
MVFAASCLLALWSACHAVDVQAHATLLQTEPPSGSQIDEAPDKVLLAFNERVESVFNSIQVLDQDGRRVDVGDPQVVGDGDTLEVGLKDLGKGQYTVRWRVNSLDGHQVQGHFGFGVKSPPPTEATMSNLSVPQQSLTMKFSLLLVKWAGLVGMITWLGGISFWVVIFEPGLSPVSEGMPGQQAVIQGACGILWIAAALFFVAQILGLIGQGMTFAEIPLMSALSPRTMRTMLIATSYGHWWSLRMVAALGLLGLCAWRMRISVMIRTGESVAKREGIPFILGAGILGGIMLLTIPMSGHAQAVPHAVLLAVGSDWVHMAATTIWIGGLVFLAVVVLLAEGGEDDNKAMLSGLVARFSRVARICVLALLVTGVYAAWLHIPSWRALVSTDYGRVLLIKLILVGMILLIAAVNWRRVLPALTDFSRQVEIFHKWATRFRALVSAEAFLGIAVLASVALLTSLPPAVAVANVGPVVMSKQNQDMTVNLNLDSTRVGTVHMSVILRGSSGRTITDAERVTLYVKMLDMDMGLETVEAQPAPNGAFQADIPFSMAGRWLVSVEVSPAHGDTFVTEFNVSTANL